MDVAVGHSRTTKAQHQIEQISLAKSLNEEIRSQFLENRKQKYTSQVMQPPHLTVSLNAGREMKKDEILRMAQKANHLTESLVNQTARADKRKSESVTGKSAMVSLMRDLSKQKFKHHESGFHSIELTDQMQIAKKQFNRNTESLDTGKTNKAPDSSVAMVKRFR